MDAVNATQIANPKDAYTAIATDPKFASLLSKFPKHPTQLYEAFCYILFLPSYFSCMEN
jgi:prolipoprotein diacylglyceryltransferase